MPEKPSKSDTGIDSSGSNSNASLSTRLINLLPAFHCILIGIAVSLASWRFFITGEARAFFYTLELRELI